LNLRIKHFQPIRATVPQYVQIPGWSQRMHIPYSLAANLLNTPQKYSVGIISLDN